jgi:DnaJ-class molecular chaperone
MTLPGYDAWRLRGPDENAGPIMEACETCHGTGICQDADGEFNCTECAGTGEVETALDEPDGDYEFEQRRDAQMEGAK